MIDSIQKQRLYDIGGWLITNLIAGLVLGLFLIILVMATTGIWTKYLQNHPEVVLESICASYGLQ